MLQSENATHLKPWLVKTLEPICDAEPGALADYILALLKHSAPEAELRKELGAQLEEFLEKECLPFIDTLFNVLRSKSYMPYAPPSPPPTAATSSTSHTADGGIPIPLEGLLNTSRSSSGHIRKRSFDQEDDLRPAKGPRLNADGQFSRYGHQDNRGTWQHRGERGGRMDISGRADYMDGGMNGTMEGMNGRGPYRQQERRGICRDYHNNGYCARGVYCKYSHGDDAVIPSQLFPMNGAMSGPMPFVPVMPNGAPFVMGSTPTAPYDPRERMDMRPIPINAGPSRPSMAPGRGGDPPHIQDLTSQEDSMQKDEPGANGYSTQPVNGKQGPGAADIDMGGPPVPPSYSDRGVGFRGHRGGGRDFANRGTFGGDVQSFRPERRNDKTLVVEKIPEDKLSLGSVNEWFSKFGTVTNVAVDVGNAKALVSFTNHDEALAAWKSEDAVFGNRFVKVFWHRPMEGHGQRGAKMLAASAPVVANIAATNQGASQTVASPATPSDPAPTSQTRKAPSAAVTALAEKQQLLEQQIAEQKTLMGQLSSALPTEKKDIMTRLRKLNEEMKAPSTASLSAASSSAAPSGRQSSRGSTPRVDYKEQKMREQLDKELEMHHATTSGETADGEESTEELKAKLAKLKAEAASLGLDAALESSYAPSTSTYRPYRGRGRGSSRGYFRGAMRGGPPRASMKLDNRPKKLLVKGVGSDQVQAVRDWYEATGPVETVETTDSGDIVVVFKSRAGAEQALAKGPNIPTVGIVRVSWQTGHQNGITSSTTTSNATPISTIFPSVKPAGDDRESASIEETQYDGTIQVEEEAATGPWGEDDGFGMM